MLYDIPDWPPYKVRSNDLQVISFHPSHGPNGYELKRLAVNYRYNRYEEGFNLFCRGKRGFIPVSKLREIVKHNEGKQMSHFAGDRFIKSGDFIVGSQQKVGGAVSFAANAAIHSNASQAKTEAARLANLDKNKRFMVCQIVGVASVNDVNWE